ncbi:hypothetical protein BV22DRAFT_1039631 [Leucogyrophana mollusca]|uniref:Uncharacterized protein n=1 Tax=Leucogyrophana mollusca TaxID=85980 RepID=A0ACB8B788_9AGAM|nr:hypothetical protein BV22DRAFT_1039631 [Leucogyrophana mollusca]
MSGSFDTILFPADLGLAAKYDPSVFSLTRRKPKNAFEKGDLYLEATITELHKIKMMSPQAYADSKGDMDILKERYDQTVYQRNKLEKKRQSILPILRDLLTRRDSQIFMEAGAELFSVAKRTSEHIRRTILSVPSEYFNPVANGAVSPGERISGLSIPLEGRFNEETASDISTIASFVMSDPFADAFTETGSSSFSDITSSCDGDDMNSGNTPTESPVQSVVALRPMNSVPETHSEASSISRASSPSTHVTYINNYYHHSLVAQNSAITSPTLNGGTGSNNRGATISQQLQLPSELSDNTTSPPLTSSLCDLAVGDNCTLQISA